LLSILFGHDVGDLDFSQPFGPSGLIELFGHKRVACADCLPVLTSMLQNGLHQILRFQDDPNSPANAGAYAETSPAIPSPSRGSVFESRPRSRSMLLSEELQSRRADTVDRDRVTSHAIILETVVRFLADMQARSSDFRDFALGSDYVRLIITAIYPVIVSSDPVTPEIELNSKDGILNFEGGDVMMRPIPGTSGAAPVVKTVSSDLRIDTPLPSASLAQRPTPLRRPSSFVFVGPESSPQIPAPARLAHVMSPKKRVAAQQVSNTVLEGLVRLIMDVFRDQVVAKSKFHGLGLFLRVPPGFQEHQAYFETYLLRQTLTTLGNAIEEKQAMLSEPKVLTNMASFCMHMGEAIYEGWFMNGAEPMLDFTGMILEYLQRPEVRSLKSVRLCSVAVANIRAVFLKLILLRLSDIDGPQGTDREATATMETVLYWQVVILNCLGSEEDHFLKLLWYQLYIKLVDTREPIRLAAATMWRVLLVQKPDESSAIFRQFMASDQQQVGRGFRKLIEVDDRAFVEWVDQHRPPLDVFFFGTMSKIWEDFVTVENQRTLDTAKSRVRGRREKLKQWQQDYQERENVIMRHDFANGSWMKTIYYSEHHRHQKLMQDQQDDMSYNMAAYMKMDRNLRRPGAAFAEPMTIKWKLDRTEGRNRMRFRLLPDYTTDQQQYEPKRKNADAVPSNHALKLATTIPRTGSTQSISSTPLTATPAAEASDGEVIEQEVVEGRAAQGEQIVAPDDDFEMVEDINEQEADNAFEDKNRKVMRRLELHDAVQDLYNVSRIIGLEASEGILIIGKNSLYLVDNVFQRADGEIVNAWQAPAEERDEYSQIISARPGESRSSSTTNRTDQDSRSWKWQDVLSVSKRRFLFRDVAVEVFFTDGRSYLLTAMTAAKRDEIFLKLITKAPHTVGSSPLPNPEDAWRLEGIKVMDEAPKTFGSKFGGMFNASPWNPFVKRWQRGEMSNFHYLMLINTMAGRTFNDLTQYPIFPWVLADYTSDELDFDNPATFRDLSKPMGAQTTGRQTDFTARYKGLQEIGETPFHYGTHYSSAMIVASFLIRLPPFVQSYMLLQGGSFDHPDRLFFSIEGAWRSASRDNSTDVRELIPEFYYLPDFLTNINGYDFGLRQGKGGRVDNVILPPWAKGDPKIFVAKHREALESPYVSENLHLWIDLVFGSKQRGEAAIENLNVFHHLSYQGARNLDNITDPKEKAITTGIIHNFGQTPYQIFTRPHPPREYAHSQAKRLDTSVDNLAKLPYVLQETHTRVASLIYTPKLDRLLCASPFRLLNLPPHYDKFLEWGYADNSVRFFHSDNRKSAGLFENLHIGQLSCLAFADAKTLITAGEDCVVSVHSVQSSPGKIVELLPKSSLFGHKTPVNVIAVSKPLSTILTVSQDGIAILWDLNRLEFARKLPFARSVECAAINNISGEIMLCSGPNVLMYTLNGELILDQNVCALSTSSATQDSYRDDYVISCAFYEGAGNEWLENLLVFTGHRRGRVNVWRKTVDRRTGKWALELLRRLDHVDSKSEDGANVEASVTCIAPLPTVVYTGDEDGRVVSS
jgi:beige protein homolog 1